MDSGHTKNFAAKANPINVLSKDFNLIADKPIPINIIPNKV